MKIIYNCHGGTHSSVMAAAIHLEMLDPHQQPSIKQILKLPHFDEFKSQDHGKITLMGIDEQQNKVYILGRERHNKTLIKVLKEVGKVFEVDMNQFIFVDVIPCVNFSMKLGGFSSRVLGLIWFGRPLVAWGAKRSFNRIADKVQKTKQEIANSCHKGGG